MCFIVCRVSNVNEMFRKNVCDKMRVDIMSVDEMSVDKMSVDKMSVYKCLYTEGLDKMCVVQMWYTTCL
jgi:hypothetical protein